MTEVPAPNTESTPSELGQWTGILGPPIAWMLHFQIAYFLVPRECSVQKHLALHVTFVVCFATSIACGVIAYGLLGLRAARVPAEQSGGAVDTLPDEAASARPRFMAWVGVMSSAMFTLVILAQWIANFFIDPCWQ
jgi:hypothetical protein